MKRIVATLIAGLTAIALALPALATTSGDLIVDGTNYGQPDKVTPGTRHWYTPTPNPKAAHVVGGKTWNGKNGKEHLPCSGKVHWVENKKKLVISHCEPAPTTTTTLPPTTTTTVPAQKPELVVTSECEAVTVTATRNVHVGVAVADGFVDFELDAGESRTYGGQPGDSWAVYVLVNGDFKTVDSGTFESCSPPTTEPTTTTTLPSITTPPEADVQVEANCETGLTVTNTGEVEADIVVFIGDGMAELTLASGEAKTFKLTDQGSTWVVEVNGEVVAQGTHRACVTTTTTEPEEPSPTTPLPGEDTPDEGEDTPDTTAPGGTTPTTAPPGPTSDTLPFTGPSASTAAISIGALIALIAGAALAFVARGRE